MSESEQVIARITELVKTTDGDWLNGDDFGGLAGEIINALASCDGATVDLVTERDEYKRQAELAQALNRITHEAFSAALRVKAERNAARAVIARATDWHYSQPADNQSASLEAILEATS